MRTKTKAVRKILECELLSSPSDSSSSSESREVYITPSASESCYTSKDESNKRGKTACGLSVDHQLGHTNSPQVGVGITIREPCVPEGMVVDSGNSPAGPSSMEKGKQKMVVAVDVNRGSHLIYGRRVAPDLASGYFYSWEGCDSGSFRIPTIDGGHSTFDVLSMGNALPSHVTGFSPAEGFSLRPPERQVPKPRPIGSSGVSAGCGLAAVTTLDFSAGVVTSVPSSSSHGGSGMANSGGCRASKEQTLSRKGG